MLGTQALILVDIQNDFCPRNGDRPAGALAVPDGDKVVAVANDVMKNFNIVIATQDWHPPGHGSFASAHGKPVLSVGELGGLPQVLWPDHCIQGTRGAEFHPDLNLHGVTIFRKGTDPAIDSYSGFYDNGYRRDTGLTAYLKALSVNTVYVMGLATDYCVKATALDAVRDGFEVKLIKSGCRGVNVRPTDVDDAIAEMEAAGVEVV